MTLRVTSKGNAGLTLIELLIVIAVTLLLAAAASPIYSNLQVSTQLNDTEDLIVQSLRIARVRSVAGLNNSEHGVYLNINPSGIDSVILYQGSAYSVRDSDYDFTQEVDIAVSLSSDISGNEVNFSKGLGAPNATGTITITHDVDGSRNITVNRLGLIEAE